METLRSQNNNLVECKVPGRKMISSWFILLFAMLVCESRDRFLVPTEPIPKSIRCHTITLLAKFALTLHCNSQ